jgi:hypothetical protein
VKSKAAFIPPDQTPPPTNEPTMTERSDSEKRETEVLRAELHVERDKCERAVKILARIYALLNPPFMKVGDKTYRFQNPLANEMLQELSDVIRAIPEALESHKWKSPQPMTEERSDSPNWKAVAEDVADWIDELCVGTLRSDTKRQVADFVRKHYKPRPEAKFAKSPPESKP